MQVRSVYTERKELLSWNLKEPESVCLFSEHAQSRGAIGVIEGFRSRVGGAFPDSHEGAWFQGRQSGRSDPPRLTFDQRNSCLVVGVLVLRYENSVLASRRWIEGDEPVKGAEAHGESTEWNTSQSWEEQFFRSLRIEVPSRLYVEKIFCLPRLDLSMIEIDGSVPRRDEAKVRVCFSNAVDGDYAAFRDDDPREYEHPRVAAAANEHHEHLDVVRKCELVHSCEAGDTPAG